jgi:biotin synthase
MDSIDFSTENNLEGDFKIRHDWSAAEVMALYEAPFNDIVLEAQSLHRQHFTPNTVQLSKLISVKTGGCPEDCGYCPQSAHYHTDVAAEKIMNLDDVLAEARQAHSEGATRFCMGAAWRNPNDQDLEKVCAMVEGVRELGMETCATLGLLTEDQAARLKEAGLDYYNHNLDTSKEYYGDIISTRTYESRLETLGHVRKSNMKVCCGGILGMGETRVDRAGLLVSLANLEKHPESVPINMLIAIEGTPLENCPQFDGLEFVRTVAIAKIMMPGSVIRLSAGREQMSEETQALCFLAGAGSIFIGDKLLTAANATPSADEALFSKLGLNGDVEFTH